jgi:signal transduction histidine kinase
MGLRLRLFLVLILPLTLAVGVYGLFRIRQETGQLLDEERQAAAITAKAVQIAVENGLRDRQLLDVKRLLAEMVQGQEHIDRIRVFEGELVPTLVSSPEATGEPVDGARVKRVVETGRPQTFVVDGAAGKALHSLMPLRGRRGEIRGVLEVVFLLTSVETRVKRATQDVLVRIGMLALGLALLTGLVLQRQVLHPLSKLTRYMRALGEGKPEPPLAVRRRDEIGALAEAFNRMAEQLDAARQQIVADSERTLELEQQLRQAETLAVAGKLTSGIAHEVGTPLNIISGRAEILLRSLPPDHRGRPDLEVIVGQIDRISGIIRSLLDTVRQQKPEIQPLALAPLVQRLIRLLDPTARRRGITLSGQVAEDLPALAADPNQLQQVLLNLLMNALEAAPRGGRIAVEAWACPHDGRPGIALTVADTGSGIPPEALNKIFQPFYTTKPQGQGTGLGLSICRDIVRDHGGTLTVQSRVGQGSVFTVWLPQPDGGSAA